MRITSCLLRRQKWEAFRLRHPNSEKKEERDPTLGIALVGKLTSCGRRAPGGSAVTGSSCPASSPGVGRWMGKVPQDHSNGHIWCITVVSPLLGWPGRGSRPCLWKKFSYTINSFKFSFNTCHDTFWPWGVRNVRVESDGIPALRSLDTHWPLTSVCSRTPILASTPATPWAGPRPVGSRQSWRTPPNTHIGP